MIVCLSKTLSQNCPHDEIRQFNVSVGGDTENYDGGGWSGSQLTSAVREKLGKNAGKPAEIRHAVHIAATKQEGRVQDFKRLLPYIWGDHTYKGPHGHAYTKTHKYCKLHSLRSSAKHKTENQSVTSLISLEQLIFLEK